MSKSTGVGRGGKRIGAGRKRQQPASASAAAAERRVARAVAVVVKPAPHDPTIEELVKKAYRTLQDVMDNSPFHAPRVTASKFIIEHAASGSAGIKAQRQEAAKAVGRGRFATPAAPRLVIDNK